MMNSLVLGFRSLLFRKRQYVSLFLVCAVGVCISLFSIFVVNGMIEALRMKAKIYYGGDFQFIGGFQRLHFDDYENTIATLKKYFPENAIIAPRFDFDARNAALYFEGNGVRQRVIKGVDFNKEQKLFTRFTYLSGSAKNMAGSNGILLSAPIAQMLEAETGDVITLMLKDSSNYINTIALEVKGVFTDSSLFGMYTSYVDIDVLKSVYGLDEKAANRIVICFPDNSKEAFNIDFYQKKLESCFNMFPQTHDKQLFYDKLFRVEKCPEPMFALISLGANLQDVQILIDAMHVIAGIVIAILIMIIIIGISSTYRVLVMKRSNEIGIYMAIGMNRNGIRKILLSETLFLLISGCFTGFVLSLIFCACAKFIHLSFIPAFDIFLSDGVILPLVDPLAVIGICIIVIVTTAAAVLFAVQKAVKMTPCQALAVTG